MPGMNLVWPLAQPLVVSCPDPHTCHRGTSRSVKQQAGRPAAPSSLAAGSWFLSTATPLARMEGAVEKVLGSHRAAVLEHEACAFLPFHRGRGGPAPPCHGDVGALTSLK